MKSSSLARRFAALLSRQGISPLAKSLPLSQPHRHSFAARIVKTALRGYGTNASPRPSPYPFLAGGVLAAAGAAIFTLAFADAAKAEAPAGKEEGLRKIRLSEIHEHGRKAEQFWVMRDNKVYDITEWVPNHPGGEVILRAAGGNIDPYWKIFTIHQKQEVYDILEEYLIGVIDPQDLVDGKVPAEHVDDPFQHDPTRDPRLHQHTDRPCNAETPAHDLETYITPNELFYVRNHLWVPDTNAEEHKLTIELYDGEEVTYTMAELRAKFKEYTVTSVLQCSGNRRSHMTNGSRSTNGLQWGVGAIGNAEWTGVRLRDVLKDAGLDVDEPPEEVTHAQFMGSEAYGASIPIEKACDRRGDVLLAHTMNGAPLPRDHGFPLRVIVPGIVAARSVKWITKISLADEESTSQWQRRDYKCFGPNIGSKPDWDSAPAIQETPVQSAVTSVRDVPQENRKLMSVYGMEDDFVALEGYAYSGGGRAIVRVDVSADDGHTWRQAELLDDGVDGDGDGVEADGDKRRAAKGAKAWAWRRWRFAVERSQVGKWFLVKAVDEGYNTQPDSFESHWNFRGNLATGWQRVEYKRDKD